MLELFEQAVRAGEAQRASAQHGRYRLIPALKGCPACGAVAMIASPELGHCADCGGALVVVPSEVSA